MLTFYLLQNRLNGETANRMKSGSGEKLEKQRKTTQLIAGLKEFEDLKLNMNSYTLL